MGLEETGLEGMEQINLTYNMDNMSTICQHGHDTSGFTQLLKGSVPCFQVIINQSIKP
jgi:hypothetical protein